MKDSEDYLMRPVLEGLCKYESLIDGTMSLVDIAICNEALDVRQENMFRIEDASKRTE